MRQPGKKANLARRRRRVNKTRKLKKRLEAATLDQDKAKILEKIDKINPYLRAQRGA